MRLLVRSQLFVLLTSCSVNAQQFNFGDLFNQFGNFIEGGQQNAGDNTPSQLFQPGQNDNLNAAQSSDSRSQQSLQSTSHSTQDQSAASSTFSLVPTLATNTSPEPSNTFVSTLDSTPDSQNSATSASTLDSTSSSESFTTLVSTLASTTQSSPSSVLTSALRSSSTLAPSPTITSSSSQPSPTSSNTNQVYIAAVSILNSVKDVVNNSNLSEDIKKASEDIIKNIASILSVYLK